MRKIVGLMVVCLVILLLAAIPGSHSSAPVFKKKAQDPGPIGSHSSAPVFKKKAQDPGPIG